MHCDEMELRGKENLMKRSILTKDIAIALCLAMVLAGCGGKPASGEKPMASSTVVSTETEEEISTEAVEEKSAEEPKEDSFFSLKPSPDKYTQYVGKYVGMNAASVGYTSLGGDRMVEIGSGYLQITYVTTDGTYVGADDEESLKNYVVTAQSIEPNTEVKLTFQKDSDGKEYDNLVDHQTYEKIDLAVKKVKSKDEPILELTSIDPSPDKYTYYIQNYVGKNLASVGYQSLGGDYRDEYGSGSVELVLSSEDGSYIDTSDSSLLKQYVVTGQDIAPNTELKYTYLLDSDGNEYSNLIDSQSYETITLNIEHLDGIEFAEDENSDEEEKEDQTDEPDASEQAEQEESSSEDAEEYKAIYDEYVQKMSDRTEELLEEYKDESKGESLDKKAEICNKKIEELAKICNEGVQKMATQSLKDGDTDAYTDWSEKLYDAYMEQSESITEEYMNSAF